MYCMFVSANGAYYKFLDLDPEQGLINDEESRGVVFYGAFKLESSAKIVVNLVNSATF